jgi:hypothetical protein
MKIGIASPLRCEGLFADQTTAPRRRQWQPPTRRNKFRLLAFWQGQAAGGTVMRVLLGMILGAALTVGLAYYSDSTMTSPAAAGPAATDNRPMVNWDVVQSNWSHVKERAQKGWAALRERIDQS